MQFLYDNIIATLVGGMTILLLIALQLQASETNIEAVGFYDAKVKQVMFAEVVQTDIANIGAGRAATETMIEAWSTTNFEFWTQTDSSGTIDRVRYELAQTGTETVGDSTYTVHKVNRYTNGVLSGGSSSLVTQFQITLYDAHGAVITNGNLDRTRQISIRIDSLPPWRQEHTIEQSIWTYTVRPANLERKVI